MGKKIKKKSRSGHKDKRVSSDSPKEVVLKSTDNVVSSNDKVVVVNRTICPHLEKNINLEALRTKFGSIHPLKCEDCREGVDERRSSKGRGKQGKKKGDGEAMLESKSIWICLFCARFSCGGAGLPTTPQSHTIRHARMNHHQLTVKLENPQLCWCFGCSTLVHYEKSEGGAAAQQSNILHEIANMIKGWPRGKPALDVEEIWFGSDGVPSGTRRDICAPVSSDWTGRYIVRGMTNLGNTCFFNSVMQNLLSIDQLRNYFCNLDASLGPLTAALRKLVVEINENSGSRGSINPKAFFGSVCAKAPQFRGYQQQDSHEILRCLLDGLSTEELSVRKKIKSNERDEKLDPTFVESMFGGQLCSMVTCLECKHSSIVYEPFLDLSLPVPTRKSPSRKARPEARVRKPKLPPRRNGKTRLESSTDSNALPLASSSVKFPCEKAPEGQSSIYTAEKDESKLCGENDIVKQAPPSDFSRLDYLDNDVVSSTTAVSSEICDLPLNQGFAAEEAGHSGLLLQDSTDCSELKNEICEHNAKSPDKMSPMSNAVQDKLSDFQDFTSQVSEKLVLKDSSDDFPAMDVASRNDKDTFLDTNSQACSRDLKDVGVKQSSSFLEEDTPSLIQDNVVLLLPYEPIRTEGETSTSSLGNEQDSLEFDGLGGLFDEPDDAGIGDLNASTFDQPLQGTNKAGADFMCNNSESEPDEVDNTDVPISVERCLSYFIKSELLTKNEHAWQCENCSKVLQERIKLRKKSQNPLSESLMNQNADRQEASGPPVPNGVSHLSNGEMNQTLNTDCFVKSPNQSDLYSAASQYEETEGDDLNVEKSDAAPEGDMLSASGESEASDDEKTNFECVKAERDATKRILINKVPRVLAIHLKRFSQDARGRLSKLNGHVLFNHTIDLKPFIIKRSTETDEYKYRLLGVVEHSGTMRNGHYVAYVRGSAKNTEKAESTEETFVWYYASDAYVRECSLEEVLRSDAYILFYERV